MGDEFNHEQSILLEAKDELEADNGLQMDTSLIKSDGKGNAFVLISNTKGYSLKLEADTEIGNASNLFKPLTLDVTQLIPVGGVQWQSRWLEHVMQQLQSKERN